VESVGDCCHLDLCFGTFSSAIQRMTLRAEQRQAARAEVHALQHLLATRHTALSGTPLLS